MTDGAFPTAMAARQLASAGMVILQIRDRHTHSGTLQEAEDHVVGFEAAIDQLVAEGIVDPKRVGIIGFSRTCWYVESALIRDPERFAAATISNGVDWSYIQYRLFGVDDASAGETIGSYGAKPIGDGLHRWVELAPGFHLDRVHAPLRLEAEHGSSILTEWEIYSSLRDQGKPVDLIYFPNAQHILEKPLERMASQQGDVDWFRFWLQGYEDPDPTKAAQYKHWHELRKLQERNNDNAKPTTPAAVVN